MPYNIQRKTMRKGTLAIPFLATFFIALAYVTNLFSTSMRDEEIQKREWRLKTVCDMKVMEIESEDLSFSEIQKVMMRNRIKNGSLPLSMEIETTSNIAIGDLLRAEIKFAVEGTEITQEVQNIKIVRDTLMLCDMKCDIAKMYNGSNADALIAVIENMSKSKNYKVSLRPQFKDADRENNGWTEVK